MHIVSNAKASALLFAIGWVCAADALNYAANPFVQVARSFALHEFSVSASASAKADGNLRASRLRRD